MQTFLQNSLNGEIVIKKRKKQNTKNGKPFQKISEIKQNFR
jgi:hypothetical protein